MACQSSKCLLDSRLTFQQDRKTLSYSASTCNLQGNFSEVRGGKKLGSLEKISSFTGELNQISALGINEILDRDRVLLNCGSADRGTCGTCGTLYFFRKRIVMK